MRSDPYPPGEVERTAWPSRREKAAGEPPNVGIIVANYNTRVLVAHLIFSLYRLVGGSEFAALVVVDSNSSDGSTELLDSLHEAELIHLIRNRHQAYHGPALSQGVSWLAERQRNVPPHEQLDYVWVLDSDVIVLRRDVVSDAARTLAEAGAAAVGQTGFDPWRGRDTPAILAHDRPGVHLAITVPTVRGTRGSILLHADRGRVPGVPPSGVPVRRRSIHHPSRPGDAPAERGLRRVGKSLLRMALSTATLTSLATRPGPNSMKSSLDSSAGRSGRWSPIPWLQPAGARRYWSSHPIWAAENPSLTTERSRSSARPAP